MENTFCVVEKFVKLERIMFILKPWYFGFLKKQTCNIAQICCNLFSYLY